MIKHWNFKISSSSTNDCNVSLIYVQVPVNMALVDTRQNSLIGKCFNYIFFFSEIFSQFSRLTFCVQHWLELWVTILYFSSS